MKKWQENIIEYLSFSVKERWAVLVLVLLIIGIFIIPGFLKSPETKIVIQDSLLKKAITEMDTMKGDNEIRDFAGSRKKAYVPITSERFYFDPNTLEVEKWVRLGVKEKTAQTIQKYLQHGGRFKSAGDLEKIYGLPPCLVTALKPFVRIVGKDTFSVRKPGFSRKPDPVIIKINQADSLAWESLPGIGPTLAGRIVNFRTRLGGFYAITQVGEVYGLKDSVFQKLIPMLEFDDHPVQQLGINSATLEELAAHPYIRKAIANAIVQYRTMHGRFQQVDDLTKIHLIGPEQLARISRYCKID